MDELRIRLKSETQSLHLQLEKATGLLDPKLIPAQYAQILSSFAEVYRAFEKSARQSPLSNWYFPAREKLPLLNQDIEFIGLPTIPPQLESSNFDFLRGIGIWGAAYVVEGSTLGGQLLTRHFQKRWPWTLDGGLSFFSGYGPQTGARWQEFLEKLATLPAQGPQADAIVAGAQDMFRLFLRALPSDSISVSP